MKSPFRLGLLTREGVFRFLGSFINLSDVNCSVRVERLRVRLSGSILTIAPPSGPGAVIKRSHVGRLPRAPRGNSYILSSPTVLAARKHTTTVAACEVRTCNGSARNALLQECTLFTVPMYVLGCFSKEAASKGGQRQPNYPRCR